MFLNIRNSHVTISKLTRLPIKEDKKPQENIKHKKHVNLEETLKFTKNFKHTHTPSLYHCKANATITLKIIIYF